jgi:hypothetical protein
MPSEAKFSLDQLYFFYSPKNIPSSAIRHHRLWNLFGHVIMGRSRGKVVQLGDAAESSRPLAAAFR